MPTYNGFLTGAIGAQGAMGPQGALGPGANGPHGPFVLRDNRQPNSLSFHNGDDLVLKITHDGNVEWHGKPSKAATVLEQAVGHMIDTKIATAGMRQRTYLRACQSLLMRAKQMTKDEFVAYLEQSIANRTSRLVLDELSRMDEEEG